MIQRLLDGAYPGYELHHIEMRFSRDTQSTGTVSLGKVGHLLQLVVRILIARVRLGPCILYYPPAGPNIVPFIRDAIVLLVVRRFFTATVFHFHAAGLTDLEVKLPRILKYVYRLAYFKPQVAIKLSPTSPPDPERLQARTSIIVPYGIPDDARELIVREPPSPTHCSVLFVAALRPSKGLTDLVLAAQELKLRGCKVDYHCLGQWQSADYERDLRRLIERSGLEDRIHFHGVTVGSEKDKAFREASIFCLPTYYESESFPVVLLEALSYSLPIVASRWRGIPGLFSEGVEGLFAEARNPADLANKLEYLITQPAEYMALSKAARARFQSEYTLGRYHDRLATVWKEASRSVASDSHLGANIARRDRT